MDPKQASPATTNTPPVAPSGSALADVLAGKGNPTPAAPKTPVPPAAAPVAAPAATPPAATNNPGTPPAAATPSPAEPAPPPAISAMDVKPEAIEAFLAKHSKDRFKTLADLDAFVSGSDTQKAEYETLKAKNPFASPFVQQLNEYEAKGGNREMFLRVMGTDISKLKPEDKIILKRCWENPDVDPKDIATLVKAEYMIGEEYSSNQAAVDIANTKLRVDTPAADKWLAEYQQKALAIPDANLQNEERQKAWNPVLPPIVNAFSKLSVSNPDGNVTVDYEVPQEALKKIQSEIMQLLPTAGINADAEGIKEVQNLIRSQVVMNELPNIIQAIYNKIELGFINKKYNPRATNQQAPPNNSTLPPGEVLAKEMRG